MEGIQLKNPLCSEDCHAFFYLVTDVTCMVDHTIPFI